MRNVFFVTLIMCISRVAFTQQWSGSGTTEGHISRNGTLSLPGSATGSSGIGDGRTHLPHGNGNNYIRGNTYIYSTDRLSFHGADRIELSGSTIRHLGNTVFNGANNGLFGDGKTHFPHSDGNNYNRGDN